MDHSPRQPLEEARRVLLMAYRMELDRWRAALAPALSADEPSPAPRIVCCCIDERTGGRVRAADAWEVRVPGALVGLSDEEVRKWGRRWYSEGVHQVELRLHEGCGAAQLAWEHARENAEDVPETLDEYLVEEGRRLSALLQQEGITTTVVHERFAHGGLSIARLLHAAEREEAVLRTAFDRPIVEGGGEHEALAVLVAPESRYQHILATTPPPRCCFVVTVGEGEGEAALRAVQLAHSIARGPHNLFAQALAHTTPFEIVVVEGEEIVAALKECFQEEEEKGCVRITHIAPRASC